jgi:NADH-quinone oxidoreductase subunit H
MSIAFFTYLERKKLANIQSRRGPTRVGHFGVLQPFIDGLKLFLKETIAPHNSFFVVFFLTSVYCFFIALGL